MGVQILKSPGWRDFETPMRESRGSPGRESHLDVGPVERSRIYYKGKVMALPKSEP
jgi:hypothetical protein